MINYIDLYNYINNPLNDDLIHHFVDCYSKNLNVHSLIVNTYRTDEDNIQTCDELYELLFKEWKKNSLSLSNSYIQTLMNNGVVDEDYLKLKDVLNSLPLVKTKKEYMDLISSDKLIYKYGWHSIGNKTSWTHINSSLISAWKEAPFHIEHKLCLNCHSLYIEDIVLLLIKEFQYRQIPFHLKFDNSGKRDDSIVIYSDTAHLEDFIQCIKKTRIYNKELFTNLGNPPILTGKIEPWLGYASETKDYKRMTFSEIRSNIIYSSIKSSFRKWVYENRDLKITSQGKEILFRNFISGCLANIVISKYKKIHKSYIEENKENKFYDDYGLTKEDLYDSRLKEKLLGEITPRIVPMLYAYYNKDLIPFIDIKTSNYKKITVTNEDLKNTVKAVSIQILNNYPDVMDLIKAEIEKQCAIYDVDINKFCFDVKRRESLFTYQKKVLDKKK